MPRVILQKARWQNEHFVAITSICNQRSLHKCTHYFLLIFLLVVRVEKDSIRAGQTIHPKRATKIRTLLHIFIGWFFITFCSWFSAAKSNEKLVNQELCNTVLILDALYRKCYFNEFVQTSLCCNMSEVMEAVRGQIPSWKHDGVFFSKNVFNKSCSTTSKTP